MNWLALCWDTEHNPVGIPRGEFHQIAKQANVDDAIIRNVFPIQGWSDVMIELYKVFQSKTLPRDLNSLRLHREVISIDIQSKTFT